jgi:hypothetical protein
MPEGGLGVNGLDGDGTCGARPTRDPIPFPMRAASERAPGGLGCI